jgi:hypothetical protein
MFNDPNALGLVELSALLDCLQKRGLELDFGLGPVIEGGVLLHMLLVLLVHFQPGVHTNLNRRRSQHVAQWSYVPNTQGHQVIRIGEHRFLSSSCLSFDAARLWHVRCSATCSSLRAHSYHSSGCFE